MKRIQRWAVIELTAVAPLASLAVVAPAIGNATECGLGTIYDAPSNTCVAAPLPPPPLPPPPPPPPPPAWNGDITPYFSVGACVPIPVPFAPSICAGI
ncbi:hypothetical protein E4P42_13225 [Mycobacterium sp. PS03-16]|uniref:hypothetical protein n=1 Tax=Mycobacterium sp. PS03-16 TaxID=2559611 RepID=UPI0010734CEE|nr:hypothetical protein [Mycobacterium sp. PS03-16]TFV58011.1 hypothetical protein E4P42_13225 [Mycobacterium sp. PS03-16]